MREKNRIKIALLALLTLLPPQTALAEQSLHVAGMDVAAWLPKGNLHDKPVVIFSHGFHGCNTQSRFLMEALAEDGYAVFAPNHKDASCKHFLRAWRQKPDLPFRNASRWSESTYRERGRDIQRLLDALPKDTRYRRLDWQHVGLAGHSLGGYTVLALAGAWPDWQDSRVHAVLALSPYSAPFVAQETLGNISVPVMYQGGTRDSGITPVIDQEGGAYDQTHPPKFFVEFEGAGHFAWTDLRDSYHDSINAYSLAFFDRYLKDKPLPLDMAHLSKDAYVFHMREK